MLDIRCTPEGHSTHLVAAKSVNMDILERAKQAKRANSGKAALQVNPDESPTTKCTSVQVLEQFPSQEVFQNSIVAGQKPVIIKGEYRVVYSVPFSQVDLESC